MSNTLKKMLYLLLAVAPWLIGLSLIFIVPLFQERFAQFDTELPRFVLTIITVADWFGGYDMDVPGWVYLAPLMLAATVYSIWQIRCLRRQPPEK